MKTYLSFLLLLSLTGCSARGPARNEVFLRGFNFDYQIETPAKASLVQVFDDGKRTYLQFLPQSLDLAKLPLIKANGKEVQSKAFGRKYLTIEGTHSSIIVISAKGLSKVSKIEKLSGEKLTANGSTKMGVL